MGFKVILQVEETDNVSFLSKALHLRVLLLDRVSKFPEGLDVFQKSLEASLGLSRYRLLKHEVNESLPPVEDRVYSFQNLPFFLTKGGPFILLQLTLRENRLLSVIVIFVVKVRAGLTVDRQSLSISAGRVGADELYSDLLVLLALGQLGLQRLKLLFVTLHLILND